VRGVYAPSAEPVPGRRSSALTRGTATPFHSAAELAREVFATFPGLYELIPQRGVEELEGALAETEEEETPASTTRPKRPAAERNSGRLPVHLPRIE